MARRWWTLLAACLATFMLLLDVTVVNVALPDIRRELGGSFTDMQWVVDAYALGLATLLLASGSLADLLGRRLVFVTGIAVFSTFRQVGIATGIAGLGALFQARVTDKLGNSNLGEAVVSGQAHTAAAQRAFIDGLNEILIVAAVVAFVGGALAFALVRSRDLVANQTVAAA